MPEKPVLDIRGVTKSYGGEPAVLDAQLKLRAGSINCLLGPSGGGKSTLLRLVAGLETPDSGEIVAAGRLVAGPGVDVPPEHRGVGMVFQDFALFPHLTAAQNVAFGLNGRSPRERRERALALLDRFRLAGRADAWPQTLSGGEQQRVAIARALARNPALVLLDEPFSGLDGDLRAEVRQSVLAGLREAQTTVLIVTHDPKEAMLMGDRLALMSQGRILQEGEPAACYMEPVSLHAARLLGPANLLPARVEAGVAATPLGAMEAPGVRDGEAVAMVRPEALRPAPAGIVARIVSRRFGGAFWEVELALGECALYMHVAGPPPEGDEVAIALDAERARIYAD